MSHIMIIAVCKLLLQLFEVTFVALLKCIRWVVWIITRCINVLLLWMVDADDVMFAL